MSDVFLSASVPVPGRSDFYLTANPFLIQFAVREIVSAIIRDHKLIWGGHPAITPMIWTVCADLGVDYAQSVVLYQSAYFTEHFPEENRHFNNVVTTPAVPDDREASLDLMRRTMLSRSELTAAVFVGGMEGVLVEYELFRKLKPSEIAVAFGATGGAAQRLARSMSGPKDFGIESVDFSGVVLSTLLPQL